MNAPHQTQTDAFLLALRAVVTALEPAVTRGLGILVAFSAFLLGVTLLVFRRPVRWPTWAGAVSRLVT